MGVLLGGGGGEEGGDGGGHELFRQGGNENDVVRIWVVVVEAGSPGDIECLV